MDLPTSVNPSRDGYKYRPDGAIISCAPGVYPNGAVGGDVDWRGRGRVTDEAEIPAAEPAPGTVSNALGRIPTLEEIQEELQGQARMAAKVQEAKMKKASKAKIREGEKGQWWPCEIKDLELRDLQSEGMISPQWSFMHESDVPKPDADERVLTKAWVERGLSLPYSEFFLSILSTYGLQPHNICPNSYLLLSNFVTLCEGHLGIRPDVRLWQFFFRVKKETKDKAMVNCGSMSFMLRPGRMYPPHDSHESVRYWNAGWFYVKNVAVPGVHEGLLKFINKPPEERDSWSIVPTHAQTPILEKAARRISWNPSTTTARTNVQEPITKYMKKSPAVGPPTPAPPSTSHATPQPSPPQAERSPLSATETPVEVIPLMPPSFFNKLTEAEKWDLEQDLLNAMLNNAWGKPNAESSKIQDFKKEVGQFLNKLRCKQKEQQALHYELHKNIALQRRVTLSQAEKIQMFKQENTDLKKHLSFAQGASSSLAAASSELETLRSSQKDLEAKLVEAEKKLAEKNSELIRKEGEFELKTKVDSESIQKQQKELGGLQSYMETVEMHWDLLNEDVMEPLGYTEERRNQFPRDDLLQLAGDDYKDLISASRNICHNLAIKKSRTCEVRKLIQRMDILPELVVDLQASSARVSGYDTRIARRIHNDKFYDKVVLPADETLEAELLKKCEAEARPAESGSQYTWTSSKDKGGAVSPDEDDEERIMMSPLPAWRADAINHS
ncbi:hypothetical protein QYE76_063151 [Lolium multiflorum]|uniref:Transposase (putative) gypsy type domain-containing protein n=1 Tax=Lolium multiflorum TaxID=4521 RepID=A0AAD8W6A3_LOLMU|nr:hypothetical protein QYE76_063151 [Lolium multiflorum]